MSTSPTASAPDPGTSQAPATGTSTAGTSISPTAADQTPKELEGIGITEHLNDRVPLDLVFRDENGETVRLGDCFDGKRPVILNLVYFRCPMLCTLVLNGVVEGMKALNWNLGREYVNVTVSFDPSETPALAKAKKASYLSSYGRPGTEAGWRFLTGSEENIEALTQAVGFGYRYDPVHQQYIHTAATFVCTPDGRLARYLYGVEYEQQTFRLALLEASKGKIGSTVDRIILYCYHYDPQSGRYTPMATNIVRIFGALTALVLAGTLGLLWSRERRTKTARKTVETP